MKDSKELRDRCMGCNRVIVIDGLSGNLFFCSGCAHNRTIKIHKKIERLLNEKLIKPMARESKPI